MLQNKLFNNYHFLFYLILVLSIPAWFVNLGIIPLIEDEAIRAIVALEMLFKNEFITPTISGELYFKKPPLYNWIVATTFMLSKDYSEFYVRIPAVVSLIAFAISIFYSLRKELGDKVAVFTAFMFLTSGRMIIYESWHGLIDITYSWLTFIMFMLTYRFLKREKYLKLFLIVYIFSGVTYLMKGLPSIVFGGITLLTIFIWKKKFKMLFNWRHFAGIGVFIAIVGSYYLVYFTQNNIPILELFTTVFTESSRRTAVFYGFMQMFLHLFVFPFELIYHFLPWTVLLILVFYKKNRLALWNNDFIKYMLLILVFNLIPYWTSPEVYPRYILMLIPLLYAPLAYMAVHNHVQENKLSKSIYIFFLIIMILSGIGTFYPLFDPLMKTFNLIGVKVITIFILIAITVFLYVRFKSKYIILFTLFILTFRLAFNWFVFETRTYTNKRLDSKEKSIEIGEITRDKKLYTYWGNSEPDPYFGKRLFYYHHLYHIQVTRGDIVRPNSEIIDNAYYLVAHRHFNDKVFKIIKTYQLEGESHPTYLCEPILNN